MKFTQVLHVNAAEIHILLKGLKLYGAELDRAMADPKQVAGLGGERAFMGHRAKTMSMIAVMGAVHTAAKPVISEATEFNKSGNKEYTKSLKGIEARAEYAASKDPATRAD